MKIFLLILATNVATFWIARYQTRSPVIERVQSQVQFDRVSALLGMIGKSADKSEITSLFGLKEANYTFSSSEALPPTASALEYAEMKYVPAGGIGVLPFEVVFNNSGEVLLVRMSTETQSK